MLKRTGTTNVGKGVVKKETSYSVGENIDCRPVEDNWSFGIRHGMIKIHL